MMESLGSCWPESSSTVMNRNIPAAAVWTNTDVHHIQHQSTGDVIHSKCSDHHQYLSTSTAAAASTQIFDPIDRFETNQLFIQMLQQLAPATDHGECECPVTSRWNINNNNVEAADNLISPSSLVNQQIISSLPGNLIGINDDDLGMGNIRDGPIFDVGGYNSAGSIDQSLECLLSGATTTNSNTDNSMEDDGISIILSDCGNLWSNDPAGIAAAAAVSSAHFHAANDPTSRHHIIADGEKQGTNTITTSHVLHVEQVHHQENLVRISDPHQQIIKKPKSTKRKRHHRQPDVSSSTSSYDHRAHNYFDHQLLRDHLPFNDEGGAGGGFELIVRSEDKSSLTAANPSKRHKFGCSSSSNISFQQPAGNGNDSVSGAASEEPDAEAIQQMKEMIYRAAAFRPVNLGLEMVEKPKRKNVKISSDPQTVAARQRREKISERLRVLQKLVPGGSKMDTASMLDEAANYLKFLRSQVKALEALGASKKIDDHNNSSSSRASASGGNYATNNNATDFSDPLPISFHFSNPFTMQSQVHHHHHPHHVQNPNQIPPQPKS